jgi:hypothetical protein
MGTINHAILESYEFSFGSSFNLNPLSFVFDGQFNNAVPLQARIENVGVAGDPNCIGQFEDSADGSLWATVSGSPFNVVVGGTVEFQAAVRKYVRLSATGTILTLGSVTGGSAYTNGTYTNVALTGGSGSGALATVVVAGGAVTTVTITTGGINYAAANTLSAAASSIGGTGTGFSVPVSTVAAGAGAGTMVLVPKPGLTLVRI